MTQRDPSTWMPGLLGIVTLLADGVAVRARRRLQFLGFKVTSNGTTDTIDVELEPTFKAKVDGMQKQGPSVAISGLEIDWSAGSTFSKALAAGANAFTFANASDGQVIVVALTGHGSGSTVSWPTVKWAGGSAPTQTSSGTDVYTFVKVGSTIYGSAVQAMG